MQTMSLNEEKKIKWNERWASEDRGAKMHGMITHTSEWNNEVGQSAWKEARYSRLFFFLSLDLKLVVPLKKSNRQHGLLYQKGALFGFKLHFSHTSGVVSEIYPYAVCIDFRGFLFMDVKKEEVKKKGTFSAVSWKCCVQKWQIGLRIWSY